MLSEIPSRFPRPLCRVVAPVAAGLALVVTACGDDGGEEEASPFCTEAQVAVADLGDQPELDELGEAWDAVEAEVPESVRDDWDLVLERWDELVDPPQPAAEGELDLEEAEAQADRAQELDLAWRSVSSYLRDICEMQLP